MWVWWVLGGLVAWLVVGALVGVVIGRGIRLAEWREIEVLTTADVPGLAASGEVAPAVRVRRRRIPLPPIGIALAAIAVALETIGFVLRLTGSTSRLLSMDAPYSVPRLFVALLFAAAALIALTGAGAVPGRRTWWTGVGLVAGLVAAVKAGSTVHADALSALQDAVGTTTATALSVLLACVVVGALWFLSRTERRDRRRVLGSLAGYAVAAVGLSAVSGAASAEWYAAATYVEESGEALAGVAFLIAVLAGVAPRLVLPADWPLRRTVDAQTLDVPDAVPGRRGVRDAQA
ncbi:hypothetical protein [Geodermatophilus sp. SYSU D00815]